MKNIRESSYKLIKTNNAEQQNRMAEQKKQNKKKGQKGGPMA